MLFKQQFYKVGLVGLVFRPGLFFLTFASLTIVCFASISEVNANPLKLCQFIARSAVAKSKSILRPKFPVRETYPVLDYPRFNEYDKSWKPVPKSLEDI